jgi:hypothetical protein
MKYEDQEHFGMGEEDNVHYVRKLKKENDDEDADLDELKDTAGVKTIRLQEDILKVFTSKNTSAFGYIAILTVAKLRIYYVYADDSQVTYDEVWVIDQWYFRKLNLGHKIELV